MTYASAAEDYPSPTHPRAAVPPGLATRVSWGAILAGAVVAMALMTLFSLLGFAIGFGMLDPMQEQDPLAGLGTGSAIYFVVCQLISLAVGGYVAARLSGVTIMMTAALHGFAVWSVTTLVLVLAGLSGVSSVVGGLTSAAGQAVSSAGNAVQAVVPEDLDLPRVEIPEITMQDLPPELRRTLQQEGITPDQIRQEARAAFNEVVSQQERQRLMQILTAEAANIIRTPGNIEQDIEDLRSRVFGPQGVLTEQDLEEARAQMSQRLGISQQEAQQIVDQVENRVDEAIQQVQQAVQDMRQQASQAVTASLDAAANASLIAFIASLLGLAAAVGGGMAGRPKRPVATEG